MLLHFSLLRLLCGLVALVEETIKLSQGKYNAVFTSAGSAPMGFRRDNPNRIAETLHELREAERSSAGKHSECDTDWALWGMKGADWSRGLDTFGKVLTLLVVALAFFVALGQWGGAK